MLLGLTGGLQVGKDTAYRMIKEEYKKAERIAFADKMKQSAAASLGITVQQLDALKLREDIKIEAYDPVSTISLSLNMRQFIQNYGTEAHRDVFGRYFWVDQTLPKDFDHSDKIVVVTDVRFVEEVERIRELNGYIIKIFRAKAPKNTHESENEMTDFDFCIENNTSLLTYRNSLLEIINFIKEENK